MSGMCEVYKRIFGGQKMRAFKSARVVILLLVLACSALQLEAASRRQILVSPEVHSDGRVTFRLNAPNAERVGVNVQFVQGLRPMTRSKPAYGA